MALDPICGMMVDEKSALQTVHDGENYWFCSDVCHHKFMSAPPKIKPRVTTGTTDAPTSAAHMAGNKTSGAAEGWATIPRYACPIHPGVAQFYAGNCPKCGKSLRINKVKSGAH